MRGDFNGDNIADLAIGLPGEDVGAISDAGSVLVIYGSSSGLSTSRTPVLFHQDTPGALDAAEASDRFGSALAAGDFNGDGISDLAVMVSGESSPIAGSTATATGAVQVFLGSATGLNMTGNRVISGASLPSSGVVPTLADSLSWADFDDDGVADLAVETRGLGPVAFTILFGGTEGLTADRHATRVTTLATSSNPTNVTLAAGDMNGALDGGIDDLIVGAPFVGSKGTVAAFYGTTSRSTTLTAGSSVVPAPSAVKDHLGTAVALGDADADGLMDLAVGNDTVDKGVPGGNVAEVAVFRGTVNGLEAAGLAGTFTKPPTESEFGHSIVLADFDGNGFDDIAIGSPTGLGNVRVCPGANIPGLFEGASCSVWTQDSPGIVGKGEDGDRFGDAVSAWNFGRTAPADLAISVPGEDVVSGGANLSDAGAVNVIYGSSSGLSSSGTQLWDQGTPGIPGAVESGDGLGMSLY